MNIGLVRAMGVTLAILSIAGCAKPQPRALFTVNYYKTHETDRHDRLKQCEGNPASQVDPDCLNATEAEKEAN